MLLALKSARDILTNMTYRGFEIKDDKDLAKCLLSILMNYFGSIFSDKDNHQQETIFHHLAQGICYTLGDKLKTKGLEIDENDSNNQSEDEDQVREQCQSSFNKVAEPMVESNGFNGLDISFDLTSLSYAYSLLNSSSRVIFTDTRTIYPLSADLPCKYIYYRSVQSDDEPEESIPSNHHRSSHSVSSSSHSDDDKPLDDDKIEIHRFSQAFDDVNQLDSSPVISLPVNRHQSINPNQSLLRCLSIPGSRLSQVEIGPKYCLIYFDSDRRILGRSEPFQFDTKMSPIEKSDADEIDSDDEDGFVIVES